MKNLVRQMIAQLSATGAVSHVPFSDARAAVQRAAADQGALVDVRHG